MYITSTQHTELFYLSRFAIVNHEAKKKQAVSNKPVSYLHVAPV